MRLHTSHDELAFKTFEAKEFFDQVYDRLEAMRHGEVQSGASSAPPIATNDITDQLRKLAELRDVGILTEEEFSAKKAELLARL